MRIGVVGAGSVGIHYARSWSKTGDSVIVFDTSNEAIGRFSQIWETRYPGVSHSDIVLTNNWSDVASSKPDGIVIGTPPDSHLEVLKKTVLEVSPRFIEIQKPFLPPRLQELQEFTELWLNSGRTSESVLFSGFNHSYSNSFRTFHQLALLTGETPEKIEVLWQESWAGPLSAHSWLGSVKDSYLGFTARGGGASMEHSHGMEIGIRLWLEFGLRQFREVTSNFDFDIEGEGDNYFQFSASTDNCQLKVVQSALEATNQKSVTLTFSKNISLKLEFSALEDRITMCSGGKTEKIVFPKSREEDFDAEVRAIKNFFWMQKSHQAEKTLTLRPGLLANLYLAREYSRTGKIDPELTNIDNFEDTIEKVWG